MLLNLINLNKDHIDVVSEHIRRIIDMEGYKILNISTEMKICKLMIDKFRDSVKRLLKSGNIYKVFEELYKIFTVFSYVSDIDESIDTILKILENYNIEKDFLEVCTQSNIQYLKNIVNKVKNVDFRNNAKVITEQLLTSRSCDKVFYKARDLGIKDRIVHMMIYVIHNLLKDTEYELSNIDKVPPHVDIHNVKVLLRLGVLNFDRNILDRYVGSGRYFMRIIPICAKLAPDEVYKTVWEVLKRKSLDAIFEISKRVNIEPLVLSFYLSAIGKNYCIFNDDEKSSKHYCPIKELKTCPLSTVCRTYVGLNSMLIFSRRQLRLLLKYLNAPKNVIENSCEVIVV